MHSERWRIKQYMYLTRFVFSLLFFVAFVNVLFVSAIIHSRTLFRWQRFTKKKRSIKEEDEVERKENKWLFILHLIVSFVHFLIERKQWNSFHTYTLTHHPFNLEKDQNKHLNWNFFDYKHDNTKKETKCRKKIMPSKSNFNSSI